MPPYSEEAHDIESPSMQTEGDKKSIQQHEDAQCLVNDFLEPSFDQTCRFAVKMGLAAAKFGADTVKLEMFMQEMMGDYRSIFRATQNEIIASFYDKSQDDDELPHSTRMMVYQSGLELHKLGRLAEVAKGVKAGRVTQEEALEELKAIDKEEDPWDYRFVLVSLILIGIALPVQFEGTWWDSLLGGVCGGLVFGITSLFSMTKNAEIQQWMYIACALACSILATLIKTRIPSINVTIVTLSGVAILLPGTQVSQGTGELVASRIVSGIARLVNGMIILLWLVLGGWIGSSLVELAFTIPTPDMVETVPVAWRLLFVPFITVALPFVLQNSRRDIPWAVACQLLTYFTSFAADKLANRNFGVFLSSAAMTIFANTWSRYFDRPSTLIFLPSFILQVGGSIGFRGAIQLVNGESFVGMSQFLQMFVVALLIIAGVFTGNTFVKSKSLL